MRRDIAEQVTVYSPESDARNIFGLIGKLLRDIYGSRELAWRFFVRNKSAQYRQSIFGFLWIFIPPLATSMIWIVLRKGGVFNFGDTVVPYPVFVLTGTLLWQGFVESLNSPISMVSSSKSILVKINFPRESLILAGFLDVLFNMAVKIVLMAIIFAAFRFVPPMTAFLLPIGVFGIVMLGMSIGLLLTPLSMLYMDVQKGIAVIGQFWMFLTPVIYPLKTDGLVGVINAINPVTYVIVTTREWLTTGTATLLPGFCWVVAASVFVFVLGLLIFKVALPHLVARIGS